MNATESYLLKVSGATTQILAAMREPHINRLELLGAVQRLFAVSVEMAGELSNSPAGDVERRTAAVRGVQD